MTIAVETEAPTERLRRARPVARTSAIALDLVALASAGLAASHLRFAGHSVVGGPQPSPLRGIPYSAFGAVMAAVWLLALLSAGAYRASQLRNAGASVRALFEGTLRFVAVLALVSYATRADVARAWSAWFVGLGLILAAAARVGRGQVVRWLRGRGVGVPRVLAVGSHDDVNDLIARWAATNGARVVAAAIAPSNGQIRDAVGSLRARIIASKTRLVVIAGAGSMSSADITDMTREIADLGAELLVIPAVNDAAMSRLNLESLGGIALLRVQTAGRSLPSRMFKATIDRAAAILALAVTAPAWLPLLLALAVSRRARSHIELDGRIGKAGRPLRLRRLRIPADATPLQMVVRRLGMDRWPFALYAVLAGQMSLVGPRPAEPEELLVFGPAVHLRLAMRPGITGLSQLQAGSGLAWSDMAGLDTYYAENWSLGLDLTLIAQAIAGVLRRRPTMQPGSTSPAFPGHLASR